MASKFYLINGIVTLAPTTVRGSWEIADDIQTIPLSPFKSGGIINVKSNSEGTDVVPNDIMQLRLVSPKLGVQTFSGDMGLVLGVKAPYATSKYNWHVHAYVTQGDTDLVRGTLITNYREVAGNEWASVPQSSITQLNIPLNAGVTSVAGDKIVVEIGYISRLAPQFAVGQFTGKVKAVGPVPLINIPFPAPPAVGSGIVVMVAGHKDSGGMAFGTCTDNQGNTYSIAVTPQHITLSGTFAVTIYYCAKIFSTGSPFIITVTGDGSDHAFVASAVEVTGLQGGLLSLNNVSKASSSTSSPLIDTGGAGSLSGPGFLAAVCARFLSAGTISINTTSISWIQSHEELITTWNQSICSEADYYATNITGPTVVRALWTADVASHWAASVASFRRTSTVLGTGDLFYGAPTGSADLVHPSTAVSTNAGSITFSQDILLESVPVEFAHAVEQIARFIPPSELQLAHAVIQTTQPAPPPVQISHIVQQVAYSTLPGPSVLSHTVAQVAQVLPSTTARLSHIVVQVVPTSTVALPDLSGLYYLNPTKPTNHDSYYNLVELKIPDPTIKTAFLGE